MLTNLRDAFKQTGIYSLGNISTKLVGFILLPLYTSYLTPSDYGILGLLEVSASIIVQLLQVHLYGGYQRWYYDKEYSNRRKSIFFTILSFLFFISSIVLIILFIQSEKLSILLFSRPDFSYLIRIMLFVSLFNIINSMPVSLMRLQEKSVLFTFTNIFKLSLTLILTIIFIVIFNRGIQGIYEAQLIGFIIYNIIIIKYIARNIQFSFEFKILKELLIFSYPIAFGTLFGLIITSADRYMLNYFSKENHLATVGLYCLGYKIANIIKIVVVDSMKMALPAIIYKQIDKEKNKRFYSKILTYYAFVVVIFVIGMSIFSKELIKILAYNNKEFWVAVDVVPIISLSIVFLGMTNIISYGLTILKKTKIIFNIVSFVSIINIIFNYILIPVFNIWGAAIANLITQIVFFYITYYKSQKYYFIPYEIKKIIKMIMVGVIIFLFSLVINDFPFSIKLVVKILLIVSFPFVLYLIRFYEEIEIERINQGFHKLRHFFIK